MDDKLKEFLPLIIIAVLYGLSGLFKGKKKPTGTAGPRPGTTKPPVEKRVPSYARKREEVSKGPAEVSQQPRPVTREGLRQKPTGVEVRTDRVRGIPSSSGPKQPGTVPQSMGDRRVRKSKPVSRTSEQVPARVQASRPRVASETVRSVSTRRKQPQAVRRRSARSAHEVVQRQEAKAAKAKRGVSSRPRTVFDHFEQRLSGKSSLSQAILHAEILGKCMALRPSGSHEYSSAV